MNIEDVFAQQIVKAAEVVEAQLDAEIEKMDNATSDDLEIIRQKRIESLKAQSKMKQDWLAQGHGTYSEVKDEREFFDVCKKSNRTVCSFYTDSAIRCKIVDKHLSLLAPKHMETKFIKINAEKVPFLINKLNVRVMPTIGIIRNGTTSDYIRGFDDLGGTDEFSTEMMEWRLAKGDGIKYNGDINKPPSGKSTEPKSILGIYPKNKKSLRSGGQEEDSSDEDY